MLLLLWPLLALWVAGASRRRAHAATIVPEPATEPAMTATHAPASSSSAVSSNEAPLEVIRLEDGTVLVERRGNFVGPPPPTPVDQPVASDITEETACEPTAYGGYDLQDVECQDMVPASSSSATAPPVHRLSTAPARLEALPLDMQDTMNKMVRSWAAIATLTVSVDEEGPHGWQSQGWEVDPRPLARQDLLNLADLMYLVRQQLRDNLPPRLLEVAMDRLRQLVRAPTPGLSPLAEELLDPSTPPVPGPNPYLTLFQQSDSASDSLEEVQIDEADEAATLLAITEAATEAPHEAEAVDVVVESEAEQLRSVARASCVTVGAGVAYANPILEDRARRTTAISASSHCRGPPSQVTMVDAATAPAEAGPTAVGADVRHDVTRERASASKRKLSQPSGPLHPQPPHGRQGLHTSQDLMTPELEGIASLNTVRTLMPMIVFTLCLAGRIGGFWLAILSQAEQGELEGFASLTVVNPHRPSYTLLDACLALAVVTPVRLLHSLWAFPEYAVASDMPDYLCAKVHGHHADEGLTLAGKACPLCIANDGGATRATYGARYSLTSLRWSAHTSEEEVQVGRWCSHAHALSASLCVCCQSAQVPRPPEGRIVRANYIKCSRSQIQTPHNNKIHRQREHMPVPGTPVGGERAANTGHAASRGNEGAEIGETDFCDPEVTLPGILQPPKWRPGYYAKVALRHTERLVPLSGKPSRTSTAIPGPTQRYRVEVKTRQKGRAAAKMTARAGLRCLVCYAHSGGCDHTRVLGENSISVALAVHVQGCRSSIHGALQMCDGCHCGCIIYSVQPTCSVLAQVAVVLLVPRPEKCTTEPANQVRRLTTCQRHQSTCAKMGSQVDHFLQDAQNAQVRLHEGSTSRDRHLALHMRPRDEPGVVPLLPPGRFKLYNAGIHACEVRIPLGRPGLHPPRCRRTR